MQTTYSQENYKNLKDEAAQVQNEFLEQCKVVYAAVAPFISGLKNDSVFDLLITTPGATETSTLKKIDSTEEKAIYVMSLPEFQLQ